MEDDVARIIQHLWCFGVRLEVLATTCKCRFTQVYVFQRYDGVVFGLSHTHHWVKSHMLIGYTVLAMSFATVYTKGLRYFSIGTYNRNGNPVLYNSWHFFIQNEVSKSWLTILNTARMFQPSSSIKDIWVSAQGFELNLEKPIRHCTSYEQVI